MGRHEGGGPIQESKNIKRTLPRSRSSSPPRQTLPLPKQNKMNTEKQRITIDATIAQVTGLDLPFSSCLNAMHEAEKVLSRGKNYYQLGGFGFYLRTLEQICYQPSCVESTAAQRAEAFLRALGKWEEA